MLYSKGPQSLVPGPEEEHHLIKNATSLPLPRPTESISGVVAGHLDFNELSG